VLAGVAEVPDFTGRVAVEDVTQLGRIGRYEVEIPG